MNWIPLPLGPILKYCKQGTSFPEGQNHSWLDFLIVNDQAKVNCLVKSTVPFIEFHDSFFIQYDFKIQPVQSPRYLVRSFKHFGAENVKTDVLLAVTIHTPNVATTEPTELLTNFNADMTAVLDNHAPLRLNQQSINFKPWLTVITLGSLLQKEINSTRSTKKQIDQGTEIRI